MVLDGDPDGCTLDIRIEGAAGEREYREVEVCGVESVRIGIERRELSIVNDGNLEVIYLHVSPSDEDEWGDEILGAGGITLRPGESMNMILDPDRCALDIKIGGIIGSREYRNVEVCSIDVFNVAISDLVATAFFVTRHELVTNFHVVDSCVKVGRKRLLAGKSHVTVVATDKENDLALLKVEPPRWGGNVLAKIRSEDAHLGEEVVIFGFPSAGHQMSPLGTAIASIIGSNYSGPDDDDPYTISTPLTGGASGSPVLDRYGSVIAVVFAGNDDLNISYAIKSSVLVEFLESNKVELTTVDSAKIRKERKERKETHEVVKMARPFTVPVRCS